MVVIENTRKNWLVIVSLVIVGLLVVVGAALANGLVPGVALASDGGTGADGSGGSISVTGMATIKARPDTVNLSLGVEALGPTAGEAVSQCSTAMNRVINALAAAGVPRANIQTSNLSLWPEYEYAEKGGTTRIIGYRASNQVNVTWNQLDKVGDLIDKAVQAGANTVRGISFSLADSRSLYLDAVGEAVRDAKTKADALASAAGVKVSEVRNMSLDSYFSGPIVTRDMGMGAPSAMPPVEPGQVEMQVTVRIEYGIQ